MTKAEVVAALAERRNITKAMANEVLNDLVDIAVDEIASSGEFTLPGLAKFNAVTMAARRGRNPQTGEEINIPEKRKIKVKAIHPTNTLNFTL